MAKDGNGRIVREYDERRVVNEAFCKTVERVLTDVLAVAGHRVHSVTSRVKSREHLEAKIRRIAKNYSNLADVTDVVGVRVTTYFEDEVDAIGKLIESEFIVDATNSVDKRTTLDPDRFGYLSLHYVCQLDRTRSKLRENQHFVGLKFEIQVRSILQHAWAEIEHDLGYKAGVAIPATIRRRFSRLAGLLEVADLEFSRLRNDLATYSETVRQQIGTAGATISLDKISLEQFIRSDPAVVLLDRKITKVSDVPLNEDELISFDFVAAVLKEIGVETINQLRTILRRRGSQLPEQYLALNPKKSLDESYEVYRGISIFHLYLLLLSERSSSVEDLRSELEEKRISNGDAQVELVNTLWALKDRRQAITPRPKKRERTPTI